MKIKILLSVLLIAIFLPLVVFAYSESEIIFIISDKIKEHGQSVRWVMGAIGGLLIATAGWFFVLVNDNKKRIIFMEEQLHDDFTKIREKISDQKLYVASNYTQNVKVEALIRRETEQLKEQITALQKTLDLFINNSIAKKYERN